MIVEDPLRYEVDPDAITTYMREIEDEDADAEFDYETILSHSPRWQDGSGPTARSAT
jgi:hypothetical protein